MSRFSLRIPGLAKLKVSDKANTLSITLNSTGSSVYKVSTVKGGWWWHTNTVEESIERACRELVDHRGTVPRGGGL